MAGDKPGPNKGDKRSILSWQIGGNNCKKLHGLEHYAAMGTKGSTSLKNKLGDKSHEYYSNLGKKGAAAKQANRNYV
jgi:hypothetical protein